MISEGSDCKIALLVELEKFKRYQNMYRSMRFMDASIIVCDYLGLAKRAPLPFSLAHGVWPYGVKEAQNCTDVEPWHWSFNDLIHEAVKNKSSIQLPHPWLLLGTLWAGQERQKTSGNKEASILVGLPPSSTNDCILYESIQEKGINPQSILIKPRGPSLDASMAFWSKKGIKPLVARSYRDLYSILVEHGNIHCPNLSSVIFFSAAIDLRIQLLTDVPCYAYDQPSEETWNSSWISSQKTGWAKIVSLCSSMSEIKKESLDTLGAKYLLPPERLALKILEHISKEKVLGRCGLRQVCGRNHLQDRLHNFLAINGMSFPSLYKDGFRCLIKDRVLVNARKCNQGSSLACIRFPSIEEELSGCSSKIISRHAASRFIQAGFGASVQ